MVGFLKGAVFIGLFCWGIFWFAATMQASNEKQIDRDRKECVERGGQYAEAMRYNPNPTRNYCIGAK